MGDATPQRSIGKIGQFDETLETWESYTERVALYFTANGVSQDLKVASFLAIIGPKTYSLLKNLAAPTKPIDLRYEQILEYLNGHLNPQPSIIAERFRFHKRDQRSDEGVMSYVAEIRKLSLRCEFGENLNDTLRDRFVCGINRENIQRRLLAERTLTLDKAIQLAVAMETASKDAVELREQRHVGGHVNKLQSKGARGGNSKSSYPQMKTPTLASVMKPCWRCGGAHKVENCRHAQTICNYCSKKGHIEKACLSKKRNFNGRQGKRGKNVRFVEEQAPTEDTYEPILHVHSLNSVDPIVIHPSINGHTLSMELDTGSSVSLIPEQFYKEHLSDLHLKKTKLKLKTYTGENIVPLGTVHVPVTVNSQKAKMDLVVVQQTGPALFGRDGLAKFTLNWQEIKVLKVQKTSDVPDKSLQEILDRHKPVFSEGIGKMKDIKATLYLEDNATPRFHKARPVPYALKPKLEEELQRLEQAGIITPVKSSKWASPVVPVVKKNGKVRLCGDYKVSINPVLKIDQYPLPRIEDIFASLAGGKRFSKIDLTQAYNQMEMDESSKELLTINTHKGLYQCNRLQFGVASAPAIWQRAIEQVLQGIPFTSCILDDMIISGKTNEEHLSNLNTVLERLETYGLRANMEKCEFFKDRITYCGHVITDQGLQKSLDKVEAVLNAPKPENVQQLRSFLGLVNYYRRFLPNLSATLCPMNELLQANRPWKWTPECDRSFKEVKELMTSQEVLCHYDPNRPVKLFCDASPYGLGCVLSHIMDDGSERPIAFASRSLTKAEKGYAQIDKEALGLYWGVQRFHTYLFGRRFTLVTDHKPLVSILNPKTGIPAMTAARLQRYALYLSGHTYDIEYRNTHAHSNADCLSRLPLSISEEDYEDTASVFYTSQVDKLPVTSAQIQRETQRDTTLSKVLTSVMSGDNKLYQGEQFRPYYTKFKELSCHQKCLLYGNRVIVPETCRKEVLRELHEGHMGIVKMKSAARSFVWWPNIDKDIENECLSRPECQQYLPKPKAAPVHPWEWTAQPWERLHVDFAGPFKGHMYLILVDAHSKWPEVIQMTSTTASATITVLRDIFARFGLPKQLVSDNGPQFVAEEFKTFLRNNGVKHITSSPYHPRTNGLAERFVETFKSAMKKEGKPLNQRLSVFLFTYRNTSHPTTGETPAKLLIGRSLRSRMDLIRPDIQGRVQREQEKMMFSKHTGQKVRTFDIGQSVMVYDYRGKIPWIHGTVCEKLGPLTYRVKTREGALWRRHVDQMRRTQSVGSDFSSQHTEPPLLLSGVGGETCIPKPKIDVSPSQKTDVSAPTSTTTTVTSPVIPEEHVEESISPKPIPVTLSRYPRRQNRRAPDKLNL